MTYCCKLAADDTWDMPVAAIFEPLLESGSSSSPLPWLVTYSGAGKLVWGAVCGWRRSKMGLIGGTKGVLKHFFKVFQACASAKTCPQYTQSHNVKCTAITETSSCWLAYLTILTVADWLICHPCDSVGVNHKSIIQWITYVHLKVIWLYCEPIITWGL